MTDETENQILELRSRVLEVRIVDGVGNSPVRTIPLRGSTKPTGRYPSRKMRRAMRWEATHERHLFWQCEADALVVDYVEQPCRVEIFLRGDKRPLTYFPDLKRTFADGSVEIVETKKTRSEASDDPFYELKLELAELAFRSRGWRFRIMTAEDDIDVEPTLSNAWRIASDGGTCIRTIDRLRLSEALDREGGTLSYRDAIALLSDDGDCFDPLGRAKLHALIVARAAWVNLDRPLSNDAIVRKVAKSTVTPQRFAAA